MIVYILVYIVLVLWVMYLLRIPPFGKELFEHNSPNFINMNNSEFRGINMLGDNSDDGYFATRSAATCQELCQRNPECKGYSYYSPGQRCYMFASGDFVRDRPGFQSGKKINTV